MNIYLVVLLIIGIVVFSNLAMFGLARSSRGIKLHWFNPSMTKPFQKEDEQLSELRKQVDNLSQPDDEYSNQQND